MRLVLACLGISAFVLQASDANITATERAHAINLLQQSQAEFLSLVDGLTEAQWNYKPGPDRWSVGETAEHIVLAEGGLFSGVERALAAPRNPDWEAKTRGKTQCIEQGMVDCSHKAQDPRRIVPNGKLTA